MTNGRFGDWFLTYTGKQFYPLDPRESDICIEDIAHSLSNLCRFGGHSKTFYCPTPDQMVLTDDLRWVPAGDLTVGQGLLGFDEHPTEPGSAGNRMRRFRPATVTHVEPVKRRTILLEMSDGSTVKASNEHPWLVANKSSGNQRWETCSEIKAAIDGGRKRWLHRFIEPWSGCGLPEREAGWLAGIADGEGHVSISGRNGVQWGIAQRPGSVLDEIIRLLTACGFSCATSSVGCGDVINVQVRGGWREMLRFLGGVRPIRLLGKFSQASRDGLFNKQLQTQDKHLRIVRTVDLGNEWVAGIETSTHTYFCEGYAAHNSVAQHSVIVSHIVPHNLALMGLVHDATEAYIQDLVRPLKSSLPNYISLEETVWGVICEHFSLDSDLLWRVKDADNIALVTERRDLLTPLGPEWGLCSRYTAIPEKITPIGPTEAEQQFLQRFNELFK